MQPTIDNMMPPLEPFVGSWGKQWLDVAIIFAVGVAVLVVVIVWAKFFRARGRRSRSSSSFLKFLTDKGAPAKAHVSRPQQSRRRRASRYQHRNPTLAETRGLPPVRSEEPEQPPASQITS